MNMKVSGLQLVHIKITYISSTYPSDILCFHCYKAYSVQALFYIGRLLIFSLIYRNRTKLVYQIYSRKSPKTAYKTLKKLKVNYVIMESNQCAQRPKYKIFFYLQYLRLS